MSFVGTAIIGGALITSKGNQSAATTAAGTTPKFPAEVQPLVKQTVRNLTGASAGPEIFGGDRVADLTALQQQGIGQTPGLSQALQGQANTAAGGFNTFAGGGQVGNNPFLNQAIQAMQQSANQNLQRNQLPAIRNTAVAAGGLGGSRQGIAEGLAVSDLNQQLVNAEAGMRSQQFNQDLTNQLNALINQGNILGGQGAGQQALLAGGALQQGQNQAEIGGNMAQFNEEQNAEFQRQQQLLQILMGAPAAVGQTPAQTNPLVAGLGAGVLTDQLFKPNQATNPFVLNTGATAANNPGSSFFSAPNQFFQTA